MKDGFDIMREAFRPFLDGCDTVREAKEALDRFIPFAEKKQIWVFEDEELRTAARSLTACINKLTARLETYSTHT